MKKLLIAFCAIFLAIVIVVIGVIWFIAYNGSKLDASSKAYVDENVPAIVSTWSAKNLLARASPELLLIASPEQIALLFQKLSVLGPLRNYKGSKGESQMSVTTQDGKVITAAYIAKAEFEKGNAEINVNLIQHDGVWQILAFQVNSHALTK